ncbi:MAG: hypothetical protein WBL45_03025 [Solirubrobacterales bacterium]
MVFILAIGVLAGAVLAGIAAAKPTVIIVGDLKATFDGGFKPKALSKTKPTPITFFISGKIENLKGEHPPALKEFILESDKNAAINVKGLPTCTSGQLQSTNTAAAEAACGPAIIGSGNATAGIEFKEQPEIFAHSKIIAFNGGFKGGVTTLFIHAYLTVPVPAAIVTTVKIKKIRKGRYGLLSVASIPKIAGGSGSVTQFNLTFNKPGVLTAKCTDGKLQVHGKAVFTNGPTVQATVSRPCTPKP